MFLDVFLVSGDCFCKLSLKKMLSCFSSQVGTFLVLQQVNTLVCVQGYWTV